MKYSLIVLYRIQIQKNHPKFGHRKLLIHIQKDKKNWKWWTVNLPWKAKLKGVNHA